MSAYNWFKLQLVIGWVLLLHVVLLAGCGKSSEKPDQASMMSTPKQISVSDAAVLDFEDYTQWSGAVSNSDVATHGDHSIAVNASGWTEVVSVPVSSLGATISDTVTLDIMVPDSPLGWGQVYLILKSCTLQEWYRQLGYVSISGMSHGTFETVSFNIPEDFRQKLLGTYDDLIFTVVIYADPGEYLLDNLSMGLVVDGDTDTSVPPPVAPSSIVLPDATVLSDVVVAGNQSVLLGDRANVSGSAQKIACDGAGGVDIGVDATGTNVVSSGSVTLNPGATVNGDIDCATSVTIDATASFSGELTENATFDAEKQITLNLDLPWPVSSDVLLSPDTVDTIVPGTYNDLFVHAGANATLTAGVYRFHTVEIDTLGVLTVDDSAGAVVLLVDESIQYAGTITTVLGTDPQLFVGFGGSQLTIDGIFRGVLFAPNATVSVAGTITESHQGSIYANELTLLPDARMTWYPFTGWNDICGNILTGDCATDCPPDTVLEDGICIQNRMVDCTDVAPENASSVIEQVEITYTDANGWAAPADCEWNCSTDFDLVGGACIDSQMVDCTDAAPANATSTIAPVAITYTTAGGWSTPAECEWSCDTDYNLNSGACINTQMVDCADNAPANATSTIAPVAITYTTTGGWSTPADCDWSCDTDYNLSSGACINTQMSDCTDTAPANATSTIASVAITYTTTGGWSTPADCDWSCDTDYNLNSGACINSQMVDCTDTAPANATSTIAPVAITYTTAGGWSTPADCEWSCDTDYDLNSGACINTQMVDCADGSSC